MEQSEESRLAAKNAPDQWRPPSTGPGWLERTFGIKTFIGKLGCFGFAAGVVLLGALGVHFLTRFAEANARAAAAEQAKVDAKQDVADEARYQQQVRTGAVCQDGSNGLNTALELNVKQQLKDPKSFQHIGTVIVPAKGGDYDVLMRFRSKNSFGAYAAGSAVAKLYVAEKNVCEVRTFKIVE